MAEAPLHKQFAGQARLVRLLLWRVGDSTDVDACLQVAVDSGMIAPGDDAFLRTCLDAEETQRDGGYADPGAFPVDQATVARLRRCADKLNRADSA